MSDRRRDLVFVSTVTFGGLAALAGGYYLYKYFYPIGAIEFNGNLWHFNPSDKIWMARMAYGEAGTDMSGCAAVLWAVASRWVTKQRFQSMTFEELMRNFSTPVMYGCRSGNAAYCQRISSTVWGDIPQSVRDLVENFVKGRVSNPVNGYNNFAAEGAISSSSLAASELQPVTVGGNTFIRDPGTIPGEVRIV